MSSRSLRPEDAIMPALQKPAVVVQVDELALTSPTAEITNVLSRTVEVGKATVDEDQNNLEFFAVPFARSRTNETNRDAQSDMPAAYEKRSSSHEMLWRQKRDVCDDVSVKRRDYNMQLPSFTSLGIASSDSGKYLGLLPQGTHRQSQPSPRPLPTTGRAAAQSLPLPVSENIPPDQGKFGSTPLLTPPEDADSIKWNNALLYHSSTNGESFRTSRTMPLVVASGSEEQQGQAQPTAPSQLDGAENKGEQPQTGGNRSSDHNVKTGNGGTALARAIQPLSECIELLEICLG
jgi:hypothetical protein